MAKQLQALSQSWSDTEKQLLNVWGDLAALIMQYQNQQSGSWPRLITMYDELANRLTQLGANTAHDAAAARDAEVKQILAEIDRLKQLCRKISTEFYKKQGTVFRDLFDLQKEVERVVKEKSGIFSRSQSLPALKVMKTSVSTMAADAKFFLKDQPHKPNDPAIN